MPCPMPATTAAVMSPTNDERCSATARITMPTTRIAQPIATARCESRLRAAICATADAKNIDPAISPATAWLPMPTTWETNDGATAANSPVTAKHANAAREATTKTARTSAGTDNRCTPIVPVRFEVSGTISTATPASKASTMCTMKLRCSGAGAYWTSRPASRGPMPSPPMLATVATAAALVRQFSGAASMTAAVAVPVKMPADNPDKTRPTNNTGTESATRNTPALATANTTPDSRTGRLPIASDHRPTSSSANSTPAAYVA